MDNLRDQGPFHQNDHGIWETTVPSKVSFQSALDYCKTFSNSDSVIINIEENHVATMTKRTELGCSTAIIGLGSTPTKIYLNDNLVNNPGGYDSILSFKAYSMHDPISVHLENLEFMPIGQEINKPFIPSEKYFCPAESHLIKMSYTDGVTLYKVKSMLMNGPITNVDIRTSKNVIIRDCEFINYNGLQPQNTTGGILWFRGNLENVLITGNTLEKFGNDEVLAFWELEYSAGSGNPQPPVIGTPENKIAYITRNNIQITNNNVIYKLPDIAKNHPELNPYARIDVLIAFYEGNAANFAPYGGIFKDVLVANNKLELLHPTRYVFTLDGYQQHIDVSNFRICDNIIHHKYTTDKSDVYIADFYFSGSENSVFKTSGEVEIARNIIQAEETIGSNGNGHCFVHNAVANLNIHDNTFDATSFSATGSARTCALRCEYYTQYTRFVSNTVVNCGNPVIIRNVQDNQEVNIEVINNQITGTQAFLGYVNNKTNAKVNIKLENNYINTSSTYYILFNGCSDKGSFWASNNVFYTYPDPSGTHPTMNMGYIPTVTNLESFTMIGNVVAGSRKLVADPSYPKAAQTVIANNNF